MPRPRSSDCLHSGLARQARRWPDATALIWQGGRTSYAALQRRVQTLAAALAAIGKPGDRVAVLAWNCPVFVELLYAAPAAGRILAPLNARLAPAEIVAQLADAAPALLFADAALLAGLRADPDFPEQLTAVALNDGYCDWLAGAGTAALPATQPDEPAWMLYTSGTTGRPKAALLSHRALLAGLASAAQGRPVAAGDVYLYAFPLFHIAAHNVLLQHVFGAAVLLLPGFDAARVLACCREFGVTTLSLAPTMIAMLLDHPQFEPASLAGVRCIGYGASAMPGRLLQRVLARTDVGLSQSYGMTELGGSVSFLTEADHRRAVDRPALLGSVGRPVDGVEIRLVSGDGAEVAGGAAGEIVVRGAQLMSGYWRRPRETAAALRDGWLHTGDIGRFDEQGNLYIVDRLKDMIVSGGENVASREVEEVLRSHPAVADAAVVGLPDPLWGEQLCAVVQCRRDVSGAELAALCRGRLAGYKVPKQIVFRASLPLNAGGKIDKARLRTALSRNAVAAAR